ncbi:MAG: DHHW family protein [Ruthenibacterium sp.]
MLKRKLASFKKYPIIILFFVFLLGFSVLDALWPKRAESELENRPLAQYPALSVRDVLSNQWMVDYEKYVKDQFVFRDEWINLKSRSEGMLLKTENNGVLLGKDHYLFKKLLSINEKGLEKNLTALEHCAARHPEQIDVMIVPSASAVLQNKLPFDAPMADENAALDMIFKRLSVNANVYDVRDTLRADTEEQLYYRTDHHWTNAGAYAAYTQYAAANNLPPFDTAAYPLKEIPDFYGTNYSRARNYNVVPDVISYYDVPQNLTVFQRNADGSSTQTDGSFYDVQKFETRDKYAAFLRGNNAYSEITGSGSGNLLVVKDSYANSFVPYLVDDYAKIGIVDFRSNTDKLDAIMAQGGYDKVLFLYSFSAFCDDGFFASRIASA